MTLVIVGTGTDVGKTVVAATLLARYGAEIPLAYWKPVATGSRDGRDTATVEALAGDRAAILAETYLFAEPLSPHLAARLEGRRIEPPALLADFDRHRAAGRTLVIETAGGLLVPLAGGEGDSGGVGDIPAHGPGPADPHREEGTAGMAELAGSAERAGRAGTAGARDLGGWPFRLPPPRISASPQGGKAGAGTAGGAGTAAAASTAAATTTTAPAASYLQADFLVDMARRAALSCLVVARSGLGTINHTLLTLEALRARGLPVAGVVLDGPPNRENRLAIQRFGGVEAILELPYLAPLDREEVAAATRHFDLQGHLAPLLRLRRPPPGPGDRAGERRGGGMRSSRDRSLRGSRA